MCICIGLGGDAHVDLGEVMCLDCFSACDRDRRALELHRDSSFLCAQVIHLWDTGLKTKEEITLARQNISNVIVLLNKMFTSISIPNIPFIS